MKLRFVHPQRCTQKFERGDAKRMFAGGPLLGYFIACPACGFVGSYLHSEARYLEVEPWVTSSGPGPNGVVHAFRHPTSVTAQKPVLCYGCRRHIVLRNGELEVASAAA